METKKIIVYRIVLILAILIIAAAAITVISMSKPKREEVPPPAKTAYLLREYQEQIGIFRPEESSPIRMINVYVSTLPAADQIELRNGGIEVMDEDKLQSIIEDYES